MKLTTTTSVVATVLASSTIAIAQSSPEDPQLSLTDQGSRPFEASVGADFVSAYFWRGYRWEDNGLIAMPWGELGFDLHESTGSDDPSISATVGFWNAVHSEKTDATGRSWDPWYEADLYGGVEFAWDQWWLGVDYTAYIYPNNRDFDPVHEIGVSVGVDLPDDQFVGQILGDPSLGVYFEVEESNVADDTAKYLELSFGPEFQIINDDTTLSIPVTLGFSLDDYYIDDDGNDDTFGFLSVGARVNTPLAPESFDNATLSFGVDVLFLGDAAKATNSNDDVGVYGVIGVAFGF